MDDFLGDEPVLRETRFEDFDFDETGKEYLYYYAGWTGELFLRDRGYVLRRYEDTPEEVSFQLVEYDVRPGDDLLHPRALGEGYIKGGVPYSDPVFVEAARWLLARPWIEKLTVLTSDPEYPDDAYAPVDPRRLAPSGA
jgi:hypothetical protein